MKLPLFAFLAFAIGIAGGTGFGVMRAPKPVPVADADSAKVAGKHSQPDAVVAAASGLTPVPVDDSTRAAHADSAHAPGESAPGVIPSIQAAVTAQAVAAQAMAAREPKDFKSVALILTNMKPTDASKILAFLGDDLVEGIIRSLGPRQAAVLLVQLPPERAATLSRKLIQHPNEAKK